jgi:hypothetical protein
LHEATATREGNTVKIRIAAVSAGVGEQVAQGYPAVWALGDGAAGTVRSSRSHPDEVLAQELDRTARTWATLERLGVGEGTELALDFFYETAGPEADRELAEHLRSEPGYEVVIEPDGVSGRTQPMSLSAAVLDEWVATMLRSSREHGGCAFSGWTATVSRQPTQA